MEVKKVKLTFAQVGPRAKFDQKIEKPPNRSNVKIIKQGTDDAKYN